MQRARQQRQFATPASSSSGLARAAIGSARGVLSRVILVTALLVLGEDVQVRVLLGLPRAQRIRLCTKYFRAADSFPLSLTRRQHPARAGARRNQA